MILFLWAVVHFSSVLQTSNFATHKWASPNANIWFSMILKWTVTLFRKPSACLHQPLMKWLFSESFVSWKILGLTTCVCELSYWTLSYRRSKKIFLSSFYWLQSGLNFLLFWAASLTTAEPFDIPVLTISLINTVVQCLESLLSFPNSNFPFIPFLTLSLNSLVTHSKTREFRKYQKLSSIGALKLQK